MGTFGRTGLDVSLLGLGAGHLDRPGLDEAACAAFLNGALDAGVTLIDTAPSYGRSEARIGRHLAARRDQFTLSTKVGYGIEGVPDWTGPCVAACVDRALRVLATDRLDIVHLHSCPEEILARGEVIEALEVAKAAGKVRAIAYSGENEALAYALACGRFDGLQCSVNLCDQRVLATTLPDVQARDLGLIAKRPLANTPWLHPARPVGQYCETYWLRLRAMGLDPGGLGWQELALRFAAFQPGVTSCIVGTADLEHLKANVRILEQGPLPEATVAAIRQAFMDSDDGWEGQI